MRRICHQGSRSHRVLGYKGEITVRLQANSKMWLLLLLRNTITRRWRILFDTAGTLLSSYRRHFAATDTLEEHIEHSRWWYVYKREGNKQCTKYFIVRLGYSNHKPIVEPMLDDNLTLFKSFLWHSYDNRCVAVSVLVDVDRVSTKSNCIERVDNGELGGCKGQNGVFRSIVYDSWCLGG